MWHHALCLVLSYYTPFSRICQQKFKSLNILNNSSFFAILSKSFRSTLFPAYNRPPIHSDSTTINGMHKILIMVVTVKTLDAVFASPPNRLANSIPLAPLGQADKIKIVVFSFSSKGKNSKTKIMKNGTTRHFIALTIYTRPFFSAPSKSPCAI